jgi:hypothetical protein
MEGYILMWAQYPFMERKQHSAKVAAAEILIPTVTSSLLQILPTIAGTWEEAVGRRHQVTVNGIAYSEERFINNEN